MTGPVDTARVLSVFVPGKAQPQGSKRHVGNGRLIESADVGPWREAIAHLVRAQMASTIHPGYERDTPLHVVALFQLQRGASVKRATPTVRPDVDKLLRAVMDALPVAGLIVDDAQVTSCTIRKSYADEGARPGVIITVMETKP